MAISYRAAHTLIKKGNEPALRAALDAGLDPNLSNQNGWSLLMITAIEGNTSIGHLLIEHGAKIDQQNRHGETALSLAAHKGHPPFVKLLRNHGAATTCTPHGCALAAWLQGASGLPEEKLAEVLEAIGADTKAGPDAAVSG